MLQGLSLYFLTFRSQLQSSPSVQQKGNLLILILLTTTNFFVNKKKIKLQKHFQYQTAITDSIKLL